MSLGDAASEVTTTTPHVHMPHYFIKAASQSQVIFYAYQYIWPQLVYLMASCWITIEPDTIKVVTYIRSGRHKELCCSITLKNGASGCANQPEGQREHPIRRELREEQVRAALLFSSPSSSQHPYPLEFPLLYHNQWPNPLPLKISGFLGMTIPFSDHVTC